MIPCWRWRTEFKRIKATPTYKCIYKIQEQKQNPKLKKNHNKKHKRRQIMQRQRRQTQSAAAGEEFRFGLELELGHQKEAGDLSRMDMYVDLYLAMLNKL